MTCEPQAASMAGHASIRVQMHSTIFTLRRCTMLKIFTMLKPWLACPFGLDQAAGTTTVHCLTCTKGPQGHGRHICLLQASCMSAMSLECLQAASGGKRASWMGNTATWLARHGGRGQHSRTDNAWPAADGDSQCLQPHEAGLGPSGLGSVHPEPPAPPADSATGYPSSLICP